MAASLNVARAARRGFAAMASEQAKDLAAKDAELEQASAELNQASAAMTAKVRHIAITFGWSQRDRYTLSRRMKS